MPLEIRELHIRVTVQSEAGHGAPGTQEASGGGNGGADKDAIVAECVEQVLEILQAKKER
jgi:hypothetical protein